MGELKCEQEERTKYVVAARACVRVCACVCPCVRARASEMQLLLIADTLLPRRKREREKEQQQQQRRRRQQQQSVDPLSFFLSPPFIGAIEGETPRRPETGFRRERRRPELKSQIDQLWSIRTKERTRRENTRKETLDLPGRKYRKHFFPRRETQGLYEVDRGIRPAKYSRI